MSAQASAVAELQKFRDEEHRAARLQHGDRSLVAPVSLRKAASAIVSAAELMAAQFPEPRWAVPGLVPEGVNILAGSPKLGKSWIGLNLAVAVASGGRALGKVKVEQGDVLGLFLEDGRRRLQDRLRITLAGADVPQALFVATEWPRFDEGGLEATRKWLMDHKDARLVIYDTLKRVRPVEHQRGGRLYDADYDALGPLGDLTREFGVCCLVVHHTRKMFSPDPLDLVSGSLGLTGAADSVAVLKRARGEADATLYVSGRDLDDKEIALKWDKEVIGWRMLGDAVELRRSDERKAVIDLLKKSGPLAPKAVSDLLGKEHSAVKKLLWTMAGDGELRTDKKGVYSLPDNPVDDLYYPPDATDEEMQIIAAEAEAIRLEGCGSTTSPGFG